MRQLILSPRWIVWHVLTLVAVVTCGWLAAWQWGRAGSAMGSALNVGYGLQWPVFAVFFAVMWWRLLRMEAAKLAEGDAAPEAGPADPPADERVGDAAPVDDVPPPPTGPSPFGPRPASARIAPVDDDDPELAEYNRMLARLAARDAEG